MIDAGELLRFVAAFGVIALVLYAFAALSRRQLAGPRFLRRDRLIDVIETVALPNASSLHVLRLGDAYVALGRSAAGISMLGAIPTEVVEGYLTRDPVRRASSNSRHSPPMHQVPRTHKVPQSHQTPQTPSSQEPPKPPSP